MYIECFLWFAIHIFLISAFGVFDFVFKFDHCIACVASFVQGMRCWHAQILI